MATPDDTGTGRDDGLSWSALVGFIAQRRMELERADPEIFPMTVPGLAATDAQLDRAAARLGHPLDPQHRALLSVANGWDDFLASARLLSADELGEGAVWDHGTMMLDVLYDDGDVDDLPPREQLDLIAAGLHVTDVHLVWRTGPMTDGGHPVLWLADGEEIQRWPNTGEYVRSVHTYIERQAARRGSGPAR